MWGGGTGKRGKGESLSSDAIHNPTKGAGHNDKNVVADANGGDLGSRKQDIEFAIKCEGVISMLPLEELQHVTVLRQALDQFRN